MNLGFSAVNINPQQEVELSGYGFYLNRRTKKVMDDIYARAILLQDDDKEFLILNCDLLSLSNYVSNEIKRRVSETLKLPMEQILLLCIHTHTAPTVTHLIGCGEITWEYIELLINKLVSVAIDAKNKVYLVKNVRGGVNEIDPIGYNRADPNGPLDNNVYAISFELEGRRPYVMVNYACHPVTLGRLCEVSPDFPGEVVKELNNQGYDGMFLNGFCGDVDPVSNQEEWGGGTKKTIEEFGRRIVKGALYAIDFGTKQTSTLSSTSFSFDITLERYGWKEVDDVFQTMFATIQEGKPEKAAATEWAKLVKRDIMSLSKPYSENIEIQVVKIGDYILVGAPGELFTQIALDIRNDLGGIFLMLCSNANGALHYVATDQDIRNKTYGGFSSNIPYGTLPIQLGTAQLFAEKTAEGIRSIL